MTWHVPARGVILDLDDTLYPRRRFVLSGFAAVARHVEATTGLPADRFYTTLCAAHDLAQTGRELQVTCAHAGLDASIIGELVSVFRGHTPRLWLRHDATATLATLRAQGWRVAILTNGPPDVQARKVDALGLSTLVDHVLYANAYAPEGKPAPAAFAAALARLGLPPRAAVMVGDDPRADILGGRQAGLRTIRIRRRGIDTPMEEADAVIDTLGSVPSTAAALLEGAHRHAA